MNPLIYLHFLMLKCNYGVLIRAFIYLIYILFLTEKYANLAYR